MNKRIMVIGGINADITGFSREPLVHGDSNPGKIEISSGGVGRNIGENLIRTGFEVAIATVFAKDSMGLFLMESCKNIGMDISCSKICDDNARSSVYLSVVDADGEMETAVSDMDIFENLSIPDLKQSYEEIEKADFIVMDSNVSVEIIEFVMKKYKHKHIAFDPVSTSKAGKLEGINWSAEILKPNKLEAETISGTRMDSFEKTIEGLRRMNSYGICWVLMTDGANGAWLSGKGHVYRCPSFAGGKKNVNGAGDAFLAGAVYGHINGHLETDMLYYGQAAASIAMESSKTVNPEMSVQNLEKRMEELRKCLNVEEI
ncbi:MAG TPA: carbohydrate kinase family protein [Clostridia bacterium]|nr:carbohydrate kinase family protein [Clostridia bacterium]